MFLNAPVASTAGCTPGAETFGCKLRRRAKARRWSALGALCLLAALLPAQAQEVYYIHTDALGSPVAETDANRNVVRRFEYEPYGRRLGEGNDDRPGYTGHVMDAATGLVYAQQRYLWPEGGIFLSVDPVTAYSNPVGQFHRYRYANNNPYKFTDPDGRNAVTAFGGVLQESWNALNGRGFDGQMVFGALKDGYDGEGDGLARAAFDDATSFIPTGALAAGAIKLNRALTAIVRTEKLGGLAQMSGMLRAAAAGKGNFGIGSATAKQADAMGRAWVGKGHTVASDGKTLVSKDGLRQYRPPSEKSSPHASTGVQANFEQRVKPEGGWQSNAHLDIVK